MTITPEQANVLRSHRERTQVIADQERRNVALLGAENARNILLFSDVASQAKRRLGPARIDRIIQKLGIDQVEE